MDARKVFAAPGVYWTARGREGGRMQVGERSGGDSTGGGASDGSRRQSDQRQSGDRSGIVQRPRGNHQHGAGWQAAAVQQPEQSLFSGIGLHQARLAGLLLPDGGLHFAVFTRAGAGVAAVSRRDSGSGIFSKRFD